MYGVVRRYSGAGARELFDVLEQRHSDVEQVIRAVPGFVAYSLIRSGDGGVSVTVCQDKAGADESSRRAAEWVSENASSVSAGPPEVSEGKAILQLS